MGDGRRRSLVSDILAKADTMVSCRPLSPIGPVPTLVDLFDVLHKINLGFADSVNEKDTITFAAKTKLTGVRRLIDVPYLRTTPGVEPVIVSSSAQPEYFIPSELRLAQNYPIPFNPTTTIRFALPAASLVFIRIYNMLGQEIATLIDREMMDEGEEEVEFDAGGLPSGVYFYRLMATEFADEDEGVMGETMTSVRKMLLVR